MFGLRLKTWMEAHLVRPRHKSTASQNQKQHRAPKESSSSGVTINSSVVVANSTTSIGSSSTSCNTNSSNTTSLIFQPHVHSVERNSNSNPDQNQSTDLSSKMTPTTTVTTTATSSSQSCVLDTQHQHQHQHQHSHEEEERSLHHLNQQQQRLVQQRPNQQQPSTSGSGSGSSSSNSTNILLGSFSNNLSLSSPDTGYSTDGYSPKSVYPALSFESSGKSTPKSSYTISSLVSSERLHLNNSSSGASSKSTGGAPSKNSSISNGLELEECCDMHIPNGDGTSIQSIQSSTAHSSLNLAEEGEEEEHIGNDQHQHLVRRLQNDENDGHSVSSLDKLKDETIPKSSSSPYASPNISSHKQMTNVNMINSKINCTTTITSSSCNVRPTPIVSMARMESEHISTENSNAIIPTRFSCNEKHDYFHHRRTESMGEQRSRHEGMDSSSTSSKLTPQQQQQQQQQHQQGVCGVGGGRNIRTSLLLMSSSQIPPECNPGLKNAFSICSPRRQRTRIKTNPWISLTQHNDNIFHVGSCLHSTSNCSSSVNGPCLLNSILNGVTTHKQISCPPNTTITTTPSTSQTVTSSNSCTPRQNHYGNDGVGVGTKIENEINKMESGMIHPEVKMGDVNVDEFRGTDNVVVGNSGSSSLLYRISTSTSASDSGKGSLEPETNRNSTESSCLLTDSTTSSNSGNSARNSIISPENTISSGSSIIIPTNINTVPVQSRLVDLQQQQQQCVSNQANKTVIVKTSSSLSTSSSSSSSKLKSKFKETGTSTTTSPPSICITNSSKPSGKRLNSMSATKRHANSSNSNNNKLSAVVPSSSSVSTCCSQITTECTSQGRCRGSNNYHSMVDKETDILSDWANTDEDGDGDEEEEEEEDDDDDDDDIENDDEDDDDPEEDCITPTPSSPDVTFNNSSSCSSKLEFIDVADRVRHPKTNINLHANNIGGGFLMGAEHGRPMLVSYQHQQHNMNLPTNATACYHETVPISPNPPHHNIVTKLNSNSSPMMRHIPDAYAYDNVHHLNQVSCLENPMTNHLVHGFPSATPTPIASLTTTAAAAVTTTTNSTSPTVTAARCFNNNGITNSKLKSTSGHHHNSTSNTSQTIARGAIGFLRKMFKKGSNNNNNSSSCGYLSGSYSQNKGGKFLRSRLPHGSSKKDNSHSGVDRDSDTIIPVGLLSPESVVVTNYPLSNTKPLSPAINGNFLTPTPNSFRRRSTGPINSEFVNDSTTTNKATTSKHKAIKTDIIRLPPPPPPQSSAIHCRQQHNPSQSMSSSNASGASISYSNSSKVVSGYHNSVQPLSNVSNTNTNSTSGSSSVHSMSITSQGSTNSRSEQQQNQFMASPAPISSHHHDSSSSTNYVVNEVLHNSRQSPYMSTPISNNRTPRPQHSNMSSGNCNNFNNNPVNVSPRFCSIQNQSGASRDYHHQQHRVDNLIPPNLNSKGCCPYDSPRLQNASGSRINSPSFNNYSPIHRLVVTGGNHHLLNRALPLPGSTSSFHPPTTTTGNGMTSSNANNHHHHPSPLLVHPHSHPHPHPPLTPNSHGHNLNRPVTTTASPLINHRHSGVISSSSVQQQHPFFVNCSPSPVLRNPRYQYITSSNQNSPLLNIPKRLNVPLNPKGLAPPSSGISKHNIPLFQSPSSNIVNTTTLLNHHPSSSVTGTGNGQHGNYYCQNSVRARTEEASPQSNSRHQISRVTNPSHHHHSQHEQQNTDNNNHNHVVNGIFSPHPHPDVFRQSHSHYYSSPVATRDSATTNSPFYHHRSELNGLQGTERIYETVDDSEEEEEQHDFRSDDGDGEGGDFEFQIAEQCFGPPEYRIPRRGESDVHFRRSIDSDTSIGMGIGGESPHRHNLKQASVSSSGSGSNSSRCKSKSTSKSKSRRSKRDTDFSSSQQQPLRPQPPLPPRSFPMSLGTYLSETETRLLEADKDTDRKYKRLINDAEALLKQISIEKSQPSAWLSRYARESLSSLRHDDCPQSDPLRRKAYDCWALRRLQHQLAGIGSPPVLHRKSPMSPSSNQNHFVFRDNREFPFHPHHRTSLSNNNPLL